MAARGELVGEGQRACPFVALEGDRDARSDSPDPRHRCYAEPTPQPRALAHQEAFCLSPTFAACPIFQDWAGRAAARPVSAVAATSASTEQLGVFDSVDAPAATAAEEPVVALESDAPPELVSAYEPQPADEPERSDGPVPADEPSGVGLPQDLVEPVAPTSEHADSHGAGSADSGPDEAPSPYARKPTIHDLADDEIPPVPPFLAGRTGSEPVAGATSTPTPTSSELPKAAADDFPRAGSAEPLPGQVEIPPPLPRSSSPRSIPSEKVVRDDVVPSWEIDGRFGAQPDTEPSDDRYGGWLTAIAVVVILALGVAGVIFLPGLLAGGPARSPNPSATILPSLAPSASASLATQTAALPTVSATPVETGGQTAEPTVEVTPRLYRIRPGDSLARIARREGLTVEDILAANPDIANPNQIQVGQFIVIPRPLPTAAP